MRIFRQNISQDCRATFVRQSYDIRASVAPVSPRNLGEFTLRNFRNTRTNVVRQSRDSLEKTCEHLSTIWRENRTKRHSYECRATLSRMSRDCRAKENELKSYIRGNVVRHSHECRAKSRDIFSKLDRNSRICHINVHSLRLQRESCIYIVNLCRKIVANNSRTSLQLSHSIEIGALRMLRTLNKCRYK